MALGVVAGRSLSRRSRKWDREGCRPPFLSPVVACSAVDDVRDGMFLFAKRARLRADVA